jgi:hypothetical protein
MIETTKRAKNYAKMGLKAIAERYATVASLFVLFIFEVFSGCVVWLILPRGRSDYYNMIEGIGRTFWGIQRNVWSDIHAWVAVAIIAISIIHIIIHWRWILNISLGKNHAKKTDETVEVERTREPDKPKATWPGQPGYLPRAGMLIGLVGAIAFMVFTANFTLDWIGRYNLMLFLIPLPFISLLVAWKRPFIGGILLIVVAILAVLLDINITIGMLGYISGIGLGYTLVFVALPLLISGTLYLIWSQRRIQTHAKAQ